jgi:hypothetical protein
MTNLVNLIYSNISNIQAVKFNNKRGASCGSVLQSRIILMAQPHQNKEAQAAPVEASIIKY